MIYRYIAQINAPIVIRYQYNCADSPCSIKKCLLDYDIIYSPAEVNAER